jgi:ABC-type multidrug transport system fused ATPase/permease subunit
VIPTIPTEIIIRRIPPRKQIYRLPCVQVLRGLTLSVSAGETVALVGPSGCGKSTLLQLLQRLYEPDAGAVRVDGRRLPDLHLHHYRRSIGQSPL